MTIQNCSVTDNMRIDRILELASECGASVEPHPNEKLHDDLEYALLIKFVPMEIEEFYKAAYADGQREMRERAAKECEQCAYTDNAAKHIRNLEIEGESFIQKNEPATFLSMVFGDNK